MLNQALHVCILNPDHNLLHFTEQRLFKAAKTNDGEEIKR